ncbi:MAG: hypothetical protein AB1440_28560 [Pseudomonadota bacterium]
MFPLAFHIPLAPSPSGRKCAVPHSPTLWQVQGGTGALPVLLLVVAGEGIVKRLVRLAVATGYVVCAWAAVAADKTVHDSENGFSLTYPEEWTTEQPSGKTIRLKVKSGEKGLTCRVSAGPYDPSAPDSPADPRALFETEWSLKDWQETVGAGFNSAEFSNEELIHFPDGYPARIADMDFRLTDSDSSSPGHAKVALSMRGNRFGLVTCGLVSDSVEQTKLMWAPLAEQADRVVRSFVLDER